VLLISQEEHADGFRVRVRSPFDGMDLCEDEEKMALQDRVRGEHERRPSGEATAACLVLLAVCEAWFPSVIRKTWCQSDRLGLQ
jgi:hypothetical protein